jgi:hypothetical protein
VSKSIRRYLRKLTGNERTGVHHYRRTKDFPYRQKHRMLRIAGLTHDFANGVTSLTPFDGGLISKIFWDFFLLFKGQKKDSDNELKVKKISRSVIPRFDA